MRREITRKIGGFSVITDERNLALPAHLCYQLKYATIWMTVIATEIAVVLCEGLVYRKMLLRGRLNPYVLSLILNACSYGAGFVLERLDLYPGSPDQKNYKCG